MRTIITTIFFSCLLIPQALAAEPPIPAPPAPTPEAPTPAPIVRDYSKPAVEAFASSTAVAAGLNPDHFINVIEHESHFSNNDGRPSPTGDYGYCQINKRAHPALAMDKVLDPYWCIPWMAEQWKNGFAYWWTQWCVLYGRGTKKCSYVG